MILKPTTKASGLISSSPHQACKDLDPTQGRWDNIPLTWPPPTLSLLSFCFFFSSLPRGLWRAQTEPLDRSQTRSLNSLLPPACQCLCVMSCDLLGPRVSLQGWAAMLGQLSAAVGTRQRDRQTGLSPPSCDNPLADVSADYGNSVSVKMSKLFSSGIFGCSQCRSPTVCSLAWKWGVLGKGYVRYLHAPIRI